MKRFIVLILLLLLLAGMTAYFAVPWNRVFENRVAAFLDARGIRHVTFTVDKVGLHRATLSNIRLGTETPLMLGSIDVEYNPRELLDGQLRHLSLAGLDVRLRQTGGEWTIAGLEDIERGGGGQGAMTLSDIVDILPFEKVVVEDSLLHIEGESVQTALPFNLQLVKTPARRVALTIDAANLTASSSDIALGVFDIEAAQDANRNWEGTWSLASLDTGEAFSLKPMTGKGNLFYAGQSVSFDGTLADDTKSQTVSFKTLVDLAESSKNAVTVVSAALPFKDGTVSTRNVVVPFNRNKNIAVPLTVDKVSLDALMQTLTGERVTATGTVSGNMPVILRPDGSYTLGAGTLKADTSGLLRLPGEVIPGDNEQVALVREIVENLHYSAFSAAVDTSGKDGLVVRLSLEGNNPDVYNGRAVKLNVNLTGDVLDFIQQNAMLITNPERLLKQGTP